MPRSIWDSSSTKWYQLAANQGDPVAQFNLAELYRRGLGVRQDLLQSVRWFRMAAAQGHLAAVKTLKKMGI
jgi:TPR repeat protein